MHPSHEAAVEVEAETLLGELAPNTYATLRLPTKGPVDLSGLVQNKIDPERTTQYRNDGGKHIVGPQGGTFKTLMYLTGHGSSTAGATSISAFETLLGNIIGNATLSASSGTTASGGTASALTTAASATFTPGALFRLGALGDGRGNGQGGVVGSHVSTTLTSLTAFDAAPSGTDPVLSGVNLYPSEIPTATTVTSYRMRVLTANDRYELHGCIPTAYAITGLNTGELPMIEVTWTVAWWKRVVSGAFPSTLATDSSLPAPVAAGSFFWNAVGTATRNKLVIRNFTLETTIGVEAQNGPGGFDPYQTLVSARRTKDTYKITFTVDAEANTASPAMDAAFLASVFHHALYTLSAVNGTSVLLYFPKLEICDARPVQKIDANVNRYQVAAYAYTAASGSGDLERSAYRMLFS